MQRVLVYKLPNQSLTSTHTPTTPAHLCATLDIRQVLAVGGKNFCPECFICSYCERQIRPGEGLTTRGEKRICAGCKPLFCACG
jgi:hypothetical protein